ncbi:Coiled-coil domain-containing protein 18 [Camelus dromedarius]|uniref:Coiled-coil domain-containing protein 18 n=1 Tax=Camelus dromedarius TaxID=9838 RepID=A0A5N4DU28_CAMDR|nr:Coiled-coil domain-containing protein 18 [Camelus dromedarius]KAB1274638.1 Coiled-coil domain-containing protein 18 [Camelus dromedarius]KAB1274639.1 Coiled-coil domain-containing protein 18 [Camelus dromedarius]
MESSSSDYYNKDNEEESLRANVASLRHELKITEWSLQSLGEELSREAEDKLEQSQKMVIEKEQSLQKSQQECIKLKVDLLEQSKQGKRAERQRNEALYNAEELSKAFQHYKEKVAEKLEKVQAEEEILEKNLINCEKENKRLQEKCGLYKSELEILKEKLRQLKEESNNGKEKLRIMAVKNSEVMAQLTESRQNILKLESELEDKDEVLREKFSLMNENRELKVRIATQNERLDLCQQEIESSRVELRSLEKIMSQMPLKREMFGFKSSLSKHQMSILSDKEDSYIGCCETNKMVISELRIKLAIKEAEIQKLHANLTANQLSHSLFAYNDNQESGKLNSLETEPVKLGGNQVESIKDKNQHTVNKQYERERQRLASGIEELRDKLMQIEAENSDLKVNMAHRTSQFQLIQEELLEKASNSSKLESEEKNEKIRSLETNINTEHEKICLAFEKAKKIHLDQHKEMEKQIEKVRY